MNLNHNQKLALEKLCTAKGGSFFAKPKSFYIYGNTGTGKTTVMEEFIVNSSEKKIMAMHFHDYLLDITKLLVKNSPSKIAKEIAKHVKILCFDEFFIESIADARILFDVFSKLIDFGVSIILTSNFYPEDLYKDGFNRHIMFPLFSDFLLNNMSVLKLDAAFDYRTQNQNEEAEIFFPDFHNFSKSFQISPSIKKEEITVDNNHFIYINGHFSNGAIIEYKDFFQKPSSIKDFRKLIRTFEHIHISNMQQFTHLNEDEAIRFRNFIDIAYTRSCIVTFDNITDVNIFEPSMLQNIKFKRCHSRLHEMQTKEYLFSQRKSLKRSLTINAATFFENLFSTML